MRGNAKDSPFPRRPLVWGAPPERGSDLGSAIAPPAGELLAPTGKPGDLRQALTPVTFAFRYNDGSINTIFPKAIRVARVTFITSIGISSVTLSTSMLNKTTDSVMGVFVARDIGSIIDVSQSNDVYVEHVLEQTLGHSMRSGMAFADDVSPRLGSGESIGIYVSSSGTGAANNVATMVATVRYFLET